MEDEDVKGVKEKEPDMASSDSFGSSSQPQSGVKKKLKTLTFCRRRKGIKEVTQKRKSPWTFKFGPKVRDCSNTSVPIAGDNNTCVCTVYRRTDQASSADSIDFSKVDCLPKCVLNSKATKSHRMSCTSDDFPLEENHFSLSAITTATKDERQKTLTETGQAASFETKESQTQNAAKVECVSLLSEFDQVASSSEAGFRSSEIKDNKLVNDVSRQLNIKGDGMSAYRNERLPSLEFAAVAANESNRENSRDELSMESTLTGELPFIEDTKINIEDFPVEDWDERARLQRAKEMEEGVDPPPGYKPKQITQQITPTPIQEHSISELLATYLQIHLLLKSSGDLSLSVEEANEKSILSRNVLEMLQELSLSGLFSPPIHTQVDYIHCLVPDLLDITSCSCYWGKMDRYEAETLLENKPEGTFLLRDSAQEDFLFSVSFQRYGKTLHARIEQWNHKFSFDSHDPGVFSSGTVCGLIEHYKDPSCCMYFDPMLTIPSHRTFPFSLQHLSRSVICSKITYDGINSLKLPKSLKSYLKEYHYKQRVKVRRFDY